MDRKKTFRTLIDLFVTFFKIGGFTFGGGLAMIPLIEKEVVTRKKWIDEDEIVDIFAVAQSIPGVIAINSATQVGYKVSGKKGAVAATLGVVLPSFLIILIIAMFFTRVQDNIIVKNMFKGIRPCVAVLIGSAAVRISKTSVKDKITLLIALVAFALVLFFEIHSIFAIIGGAVAGILIKALFPDKSLNAEKRNVGNGK